jgi:hypothetical protein
VETEQGQLDTCEQEVIIKLDALSGVKVGEHRYLDHGDSHEH